MKLISLMLLSQVLVAAPAIPSIGKRDTGKPTCKARPPVTPNNAAPVAAQVANSPPPAATTTQAAPAPAGPTPDASLPTSSLTWYEFKGGPAYCDGKTRQEHELVIAMSTRLVQGKCGRKARLYHANGKTVDVTVVDACDENGGCRANNIDGTRGVWDALGLNLDIGVSSVRWHML